MQQGTGKTMSPDNAPIGIFDSGVGGLSVLREIRVQIPFESVLYFADQGHVPYGQRKMEQVRAFSEEITQFLLYLGAKLIVVACNAASAAALPAGPSICNPQWTGKITALKLATRSLS